MTGRGRRAVGGRGGAAAADRHAGGGGHAAESQTGGQHFREPSRGPIVGRRSYFTVIATQMGMRHRIVWGRSVGVDLKNVNY